MHIYRINKPILDLPAEHPARRFLEAFIDCRLNCVGKEIKGIDQEWFSGTDLRAHSFSSFAYEHLAFDIELDGWLQHAKHMTDSERQALKAIPRMKALLQECQTVALDADNAPIAAMCDKVVIMLELWKSYIGFRLQQME